MSTIVYITSGKVGLHRFTYNELSLLEENKVQFILCFTQLKDGPCMPKSNWSYVKASRVKALLQFNGMFFRRGFFQMFLEAYRLKVLPYFFMALSFYQDIRNRPVTSIHCQMGDQKLYIGYFLKKLLHKPLTVTVHAHELYQRQVYDNNDQIKKLFASCDKVLTISDFNKTIILDKFGVQEENIKLMRLFPEIDTLDYVVDKVKILVVANWVEKKGYKILFEALQKINRKDVVLWVVGGSNHDSDAVDLNVLINNYDIRHQVALLGRQSSPVLDILFNACDFFCLPSYTDFYPDGNPSEREGIPVALMEAMAWGKPVIATRHAGNAELVSEILVEERDVDGLVSALNYLIDNPGKWGEMGARNKRSIEQRFSKSNISSLVSVLNDFK